MTHAATELAAASRQPAYYDEAPVLGAAFQVSAASKWPPNLCRLLINRPPSVTAKMRGLL